MKRACEKLEILYQDDYIVAVNKPAGLLVHRSLLDRNEKRFALQIVRNQTGCRVYPLHRLDKPTSGILLFALSPEAAGLFSPMFASGRIKKNISPWSEGTPRTGVLSITLSKR